MLINTGKNTPIIDSNGEKGINSQKKIDEIVLHPMHSVAVTLSCERHKPISHQLCTFFHYHDDDDSMMILIE